MLKADLSVNLTRRVNDVFMAQMCKNVNSLRSYTRNWDETNRLFFCLKCPIRSFHERQEIYIAKLGGIWRFKSWAPHLCVSIRNRVNVQSKSKRILSTQRGTRPWASGFYRIAESGLQIWHLSILASTDKKTLDPVTTVHLILCFTWLFMWVDLISETCSAILRNKKAF